MHKSHHAPREGATYTEPSCFWNCPLVFSDHGQLKCRNVLWAASPRLWELAVASPSRVGLLAWALGPGAHRIPKLWGRHARPLPRAVGPTGPHVTVTTATAGSFHSGHLSQFWG